MTAQAIQVAEASDGGVSMSYDGSHQEGDGWFKGDLLLGEEIGQE